MISVGSTQISNITVGSTSVGRIDVGSVKVFPDDNISISVYPTSLSMPAEASSSTITVTSNVSGWGFSASTSWLSVSKSNNTITVVAGANRSYSARTGSVDVYYNGIVRASATVNQADSAVTYVFEVLGQQGANPDYTGGVSQVFVLSTRNGAAQGVTYSISDSWVTFGSVIDGSQTGQKNYYFNVGMNSVKSARTATITFTQDGSLNSSSVTITQGAYTDAFDGISIKARNGNWVLGTVTAGTTTVNGHTYPLVAAILACDQPITTNKRVNFDITVSRLKNLAYPQSGTTTVSLSGLSQTISSGALVTYTGTTYYGANVILTDTSIVNGEWANTPGTHTTLTPVPAQAVTNAKINYTLNV